MAYVKDLARPDSIVDPRLNAGMRTSSRSFAITPSDTTDFVKQPREIDVGGAGTVACVLHDNSVITFTCVAGQTITQICKRVNATGTTATGLVGVM